MSPSLTYRTRDRVLVAAAGGQLFQFPTQSGHSLGKFTQVEGLDVSWDLYDYGSDERGAVFPVIVSSCQQLRTKPVIVVNNGMEGPIIHGWPVCAGSWCLAVTRGWEDLLRVLGDERRGSIRFVR